jgi:F0F1-type ATP synthase membrane subunit b/b'
MSTQQPDRQTEAPTVTPLPRIEDLARTADGGYTEQAVREAFEAFRRHTLQLQSQLRVVQAAAGTMKVEPTAHAIRMDALHLIRAAAEFADLIEQDAQNASAVQLSRAEEEIRRQNNVLQQRQTEVDRFRQESERQRADILNQAKTEAREIVANAAKEASQEVREAESRAAKLIEQSRHQATELTNAARAEVEQTLEWARSQASVIVGRAQQGAEKLLGAAGLGAETMGRVVESIVGAAPAEAEAKKQPPAAAPKTKPAVKAAPEPAPEEAAPEPAAEAEQPPDEAG